MKRIPCRWAVAFAAVFAVLAAIVFWGTWSADVSPIMPDTSTSYAANWTAQHWAAFFATFYFDPRDILYYVVNPYWLQEFDIVLSLFLAAFALAWFCRGKGLSHLASYGAGLLLAFSGYWCTLFSAGHVGWFHWMSYGVFAFGLVDRFVRTGAWRYAILLGADVACASFTQQDLWLLFTVFTALYFVFRLLVETRQTERTARQSFWMRTLRGTLAAAVVFALISLPSFIGLYEGAYMRRLHDVGKDTAKTEQPADATAAAEKTATSDKNWEYVTNWSLPPEDTLEFLVPRVHGDTSCPLSLSIALGKRLDLKPYNGRLGRPLNAPAGNYRQHSVYVGFVTILFAFLGVLSAVFRRREQGASSEIWFFAVAAVIFYLLSLGRFFPWAYRIIFALPAGDLIRCPVKWHHLTELCLAVLAAYGIESALRFRFATRWRFWPFCVGALVLAGALHLAIEDSRFCIPCSVRAARANGCTQSVSVMRKSDFANPQVIEAVRRGHIVSLANYLGNADYYLVGVLAPNSPAAPIAPASLPRRAMNLLSMLTTCAVLAFAIRGFLRATRGTKDCAAKGAQ